MTNEQNKDVRTLDIVTHEVGLLEMEDGRSTTEDRRWAQSVVDDMRSRIAEFRRARLPDKVPIKRAAPITARLLAMPRAMLESLFATLTEQWGPQAQFAYRDLDTLSDNDLRRMIQTIESTKRR